MSIDSKASRDQRRGRRRPLRAVQARPKSPPGLPARHGRNRQACLLPRAGEFLPDPAPGSRRASVRPSEVGKGHNGIPLPKGRSVWHAGWYRKGRPFARASPTRSPNSAIKCCCPRLFYHRRSPGNEHDALVCHSIRRPGHRCRGAARPAGLALGIRPYGAQPCARRSSLPLRGLNAATHSLGRRSSKNQQLSLGIARREGQDTQELRPRDTRLGRSSAKEQIDIQHEAPELGRRFGELSRPSRPRISLARRRALASSISSGTFCPVVT